MTLHTNSLASDKSQRAKKTALTSSGLIQVMLPPGKEIRRRRKGRKFPGGVVADTPVTPHVVQDAKVLTADVLLPPIIPLPINTSNGGGAIGTGLPVQLIFWGGAWNQAATNPSAGAILGSVQTILRGPWMSGLRQYGVRRCNLGGAIVVTGPAPPGTYKDSDIQDLIWALIDDNKFPEPDDPGGRMIYMVFMPPGTTYGPGGIRGKHVVASDYDFPFDTDHAWVGFVVFNSSIGQITSTFCHELAETCTDPESDAWTVTGNQEIGDVCNFVDQTINGILYESYWSAADNACLLPTAYSVRRALKWSGHVLGGKGLSSIQKPIPSLNAFIVNL
jgi:hypothetical protein